MKRDAEATRERILTAASVEFAERGFAGARIDRIAAGATSNVRLIYAHFDSKENLFAVTLDRASVTAAIGKLHREDEPSATHPIGPSTG